MMVKKMLCENCIFRNNCDEEHEKRAELGNACKCYKKYWVYWQTGEKIYHPYLNASWRNPWLGEKEPVKIGGDKKEIELQEKLLQCIQQWSEKPAFTGFPINLDGFELLALHGALILASKHPLVQAMKKTTLPLINKIIENVEKWFERFGLNITEIKKLRNDDQDDNKLAAPTFGVMLLPVDGKTTIIVDDEMPATINDMDLVAPIDAKHAEEIVNDPVIAAKIKRIVEGKKPAPKQKKEEK